MEAKESELINLQTENNKHKREPSNIKVKQFNENHFKSSQITSSLNSSDSKTEKYAETAEKTPLHPFSQPYQFKPQCLLREHHFPPASFPLNCSEHQAHFEPRAPQNIKLLPTDVTSIYEFNSLNKSHLCEHCETGDFFNNHH